MIIRRHFLWGVNEDSGSNGWLSTFIPKSAGFSPNHGAGVLHDAFEHGLGEDGSFRYEALAFGRLLALRYRTGMFIGGLFNLGAELHDIWSNDSCSESFTAPRVGTCRDIAEPISEMVSAFAKAERRDRSDNVLGPVESKTHHIALANLLQIGYRDALRRFGGMDGIHRYGSAAVRFVADFKTTAENDDLLVLDYDTVAGKFTHRVVYDRDENGHLKAEWARLRVQRWHRGY